MAPRIKNECEKINTEIGTVCIVHTRRVVHLTGALAENMRLSQFSGNLCMCLNQQHAVKEALCVFLHTKGCCTEETMSGEEQGVRLRCPKMNIIRSFAAIERNGTPPLQVTPIPLVLCCGHNRERDERGAEIPGDDAFRLVSCSPFLIFAY